MEIVICENCGSIMTYATKDIDGTNLEEVYECSNPNCENYVFYDFADALLKEGDTIGYHGREGKIIDIGKTSATIYFSDIEEEKMIEIEEIVEQNI